MAEHLDILGRTETALRNRVKEEGTIIAGLIDPEEFTPSKAASVAKNSARIGLSAVFVGGSTIADQQHLDDVVIRVKRDVTIPVILFPGNITGVSRYADAILFSSLLNSTNPYFIIGAQSIGAIHVYRCKLEAIPMGYIVFGEESTTGFVGQVHGLPFDKPSIAVMYSLAAQYLGMRSLYLEAGSGSSAAVPAAAIRAVRKYFKGLLIVGGGIREPKQVKELSQAGADILVIGNLLESDDYEERLAKLVAALRKGH